jgi:uncharacterized protein YbjT (DUF2867 family)
MEITLVGANGLIGNMLLNKLIVTDTVTKIHLLLRKENPTLPISDKIQTHIVDFTNDEDLKKSIHGDCLICSIGTTKAKTPVISDYEKIDRDIPVKLSLIAKENNIIEYHLISAVGADSRSNLFYSRIKGEAEEGVINSGIKTIFIYRPGLLIGKRTEFRFGELIAQKLNFLIDLFMIGPLKKYHSIKAEKLANVIIRNMKSTKKGEISINYYPFT